MTPLHPQARAVLDEIAAGRLSVSRPCDIAELRRLEQIEARFSGPPQVVASVSDMDIDGPSGPLRIRLYSPDAVPSFPAVMFMHGGGWALGSVELSDHLCRALCRASNMLVASVDYRLAPEHPFPAGLEDSFAALLWLHGQPDVSAIAVCGESGGGNLAGVAPAFILTAEYDPLVDEGERYARLLQQSGVQVTARRYDGMIHGFVSYLGRVDAAQAAIDECARVLSEAMGTQT